MIYQIFSVRDIQIEAFLQPFFSATTGSALRSLTEVLNDPQNPFAKSASDYVLYHVGSFDDGTGLLVPIDPHRVVGLLELVMKNVN